MKHKIGLIFAAAASLGLAAPLAAADPYIGEVQTFAGNYCPRGYAPLQGQLLLINQNVALFSFLGTTYGGDGITKFALPSAKAIPTLTQGAPLLPCIALVGIYPPQN